jgi:hypothetical protein
MPHTSRDDDEDRAYNRSPASSSASTRSGNSRPRSSQRHSKREKKKAGAAAVEYQRELTRQLASLQLPHMPPPPAGSTPSDDEEPPTLRILVVADIDLASASALAESALGGTSSNSSTTAETEDDNPLHRVDLCIACGPFCREDDLRNYYQGRQRRRHMARYNNTKSASASTNTNSPSNAASKYSSTPPGYAAANTSAAPIFSKRGNNALLPLPPMPTQYPYKRTREETAALEGLMTAALSQLESIVCRVVFVPGRSDPITAITSSSTSVSYTKERRLTPNSRNIHQHWMPLSPGLGCAGLLYLDGQRLQQLPPPLEDDEDHDHDDDDDDDDDDDSESSSVIPEDSSFSYGGDDNLGSVPPPLSAVYDAQRAQQYGYVLCCLLWSCVVV